jgi:hypothetical protein
MRRKALFALAAVGLLGGFAGTVFADPAVSGTYKLSSKKYGTSWGSTSEVKLWLENLGNGQVRVTRQERGGTALAGTGTLDNAGWIRVNFDKAIGLANLPIFNGGTVVNPGDYRATYRVNSNNRVTYGYYRGIDRNNNRVTRTETGSKVAAEPVPGGSVTPPPSTDTPPPANDLASLKAQVVRVDAVGTIDIKDVPGDSLYERRLGQAEPSVSEPAAILKARKLSLRVFVAAERQPSAPIAAKLTGTAGGRVLFSKDVNLSQLPASGAQFEVESADVISQKVAINELDVAWKLNETAIGSSKLRIYTIHATPVHNIAWDSEETVTKRHLENACRWANGASKNIGQGADSIAYQIDNQMRHYVHHSDLGNLKPAVPDYAANAAKPVNYDDLEGYISNGTRSISSLYYPPLEPTKDYEEYEHYRSNFGWHLLDNATHTGGRCNQQASLVCAIVGTVGLKGQVHYLERTGRGKTTGRPVRQYFFAQGGGGPWNFHGVANVEMDDGSKWIYDGSFSFPPNRKNGTQTWAENAGGPFIGSWADWYYEDVGGKVPANDRPDTWRGVPRGPNG